MNELIEIEETHVTLVTRLYARGHKDLVPISDIPPQHRRLDYELSIWGAWNRTRRSRVSIGSLESLYTKLGSPPSTAPLSESAPAFCVELERCVLRLPSKPRRAIRLCYVSRYSPSGICAALFLRPQRYHAYMHIVRCMVSNIRRLLMAKSTTP